MTAYIAAHVVPFVLILVVGAIISLLIRNQLAHATAGKEAGLNLGAIGPQERSPFARAAEERFATNFFPPPQILELSVGTDHEYYDVPKSGLYSYNKRLKLKLENISRSKTIASGKVQILSIEPPCGYRGPWLLAEGLTLAAGDHIFLPLASYNELRELDKGMTPEDTFQIESVPSKQHHQPLLGTENQPHVLSLRATATDVPFCDIKVKLWVDENGRFQIEKI